MNKLIYSPKDSPIIGQWKEVKKIVGNLRNHEYLESLVSQAKSQKNFIGKNDEEVLKFGLALNVPNFWWVYLYLYGFPSWCAFGIPLLLMIFVIWLGVKIFRMNITKENYTIS